MQVDFPAILEQIEYVYLIYEFYYVRFMFLQQIFFYECAIK